MGGTQESDPIVSSDPVVSPAGESVKKRHKAEHVDVHSAPKSQLVFLPSLPHASPAAAAGLVPVRPTAATPSQKAASVPAKTAGSVPGLVIDRHGSLSMDAERERTKRKRESLDQLKSHLENSLKGDLVTGEGEVRKGSKERGVREGSEEKQEKGNGAEKRKRLDDILEGSSSSGDAVSGISTGSEGGSGGGAVVLEGEELSLYLKAQQSVGATSKGRMGASGTDAVSSMMGFQGRGRCGAVGAEEDGFTVQELQSPQVPKHHQQQREQQQAKAMQKKRLSSELYGTESTRVPAISAGLCTPGHKSPASHKPPAPCKSPAADKSPAVYKSPAPLSATAARSSAADAGTRFCPLVVPLAEDKDYSHHHTPLPMNTPTRPLQSPVLAGAAANRIAGFPYGSGGKQSDVLREVNRSREMERGWSASPAKKVKITDKVHVDQPAGSSEHVKAAAHVLHKQNREPIGAPSKATGNKKVVKQATLAAFLGRRKSS
ncbi:unnamed protein product [Closterium sp. Yama58-4]|nr:unnamed protein product [Closterium sp. Yama58-4]